MNFPGVSLQPGTMVPFASNVESLGVMLGSTLSWKPQIDSLTKKMNRALYGLKCIKSDTTEVLRRSLVTALVVTHLDYCTVVYLDAPTDL